MTEMLPLVAPAKEPDWISVVEVQHDVETDLYAIVVECLVRGGELRRFELAPNLMADPKRALQFLLDRGVLPITDVNKNLQEIAELFRKKDVPTVKVIYRTGWQGQDFIFPDQVVGPNQGQLRYRPEDPRKQIATERSTCKAWRKAFRSLFKSSSALTTLAAAAFVGPLLQPLGRTGFSLLHVVGGTAHARELAIRTALAVAGPAQETEFLPHGAAPARLQTTIEARRDQVVGFVNNPAHGDIGSRSKAIAATAASAVLGSFRSPQEAVPGTQRLVPFSLDRSFEEKDLIGASPNICLVPLHPKGLLFDPSDEDGALAEDDAVKSLDLLASRTWGGALPRFVLKLQRAPDAINRVISWEQEFLDNVDGNVAGASERQIRTFALIYAAARLASEFKVTPWDEMRARKAITRVLRRSIKRQRPAEDEAGQALRKLASHMGKKDLFPRMEKGEEFPEAAQQMAWGIRRKIGKTNVVAVLRDQLRRLVPEGLEQATLRAWAREGVILPGKDAEHHTKQLQVQGMTPERPSFICVKASVLRKLVPAKAK